MSFSFVWLKKRNSKLLKGEFLNFIKFKRVSKRLRKKLRKPNKRKRFLRTKNYKFFTFFKLTSFLRIRGVLKLKRFYDLFFWVRFLSSIPNFKSVFFLRDRRRSLEFSAKRHSILFIPLERRSLSISRVLTKRITFWLTPRILIRYRKLHLRFILFNFLIKYFLFALFLRNLIFLPVSFLKNHYLCWLSRITFFFTKKRVC